MLEEDFHLLDVERLQAHDRQAAPGWVAEGVWRGGRFRGSQIVFPLDFSIGVGERQAGRSPAVPYSLALVPIRAADSSARGDLI